MMNRIILLDERYFTAAMGKDIANNLIEMLDGQLIVVRCYFPTTEYSMIKIIEI